MVPWIFLKNYYGNKSMKILTLSGWGQPHDALEPIAPSATHFDYSDFGNVADVLGALAEVGQNYDAIIGWSLGGQMAVRAISAGLIRPKKLVLIGAPFQFVRSDFLNLGMPQDQFQKFRDNYLNNSARTLAKAWELVAIGDKNSEIVKEHLQKYNKEKMLEKNWLNWLDLLNSFSCNSLDFNNFSRMDILLLHGAGDAVVSHNQAQEFVKNIPSAKHILLKDAGHAPHWHDSAQVRQHIERFLSA